jgi:hypothetical protein
MKIDLGYGFFASDEVMEHYVKFICKEIEEMIKTHCGASVNSRDGFPMKGHYVPVKLEVVEVMKRSASLRMKTLGFTKEFTLYMSRHKSPDKILHELQYKIDELTLEIIKENDIDQNRVHSEHHPLRNLNFKLP